VTVAVVEVESDHPDEELAAAYREVSESAEEWDDASDEAWDGLDK